MAGDPISQELKEVYLKMEIKKDCTNYTEICVTSPVMKLLGGVLRNRIKKEYNGIEGQKVFLKATLTFPFWILMRSLFIL